MSHPLAENIERLMEDRRMSMNELARKAGLGQTGIYDIIRGRLSSPKLATIEKIATALGVTVVDLLHQGRRWGAEKAMLEAFAALPDADQDRLIQTAEAWAAAQNGSKA